MEETNEVRGTETPVYNEYYESLWGTQPSGGKEDQKTVLKPIRKHFSRLGLWFFLGGVIMYAAQIVVLLPVALFKPDWVDDVNISILLSALPLYLVGMPALIAMVRTVPGQAPEKHSMKAGHFILAAIMCFAIMYILNFLGTLLTELIGMLKGWEVEDVLDSALTGASIPLVFAYTVICAPIMEEFVFRKLIVDRTMRYGQGVAVLLSGLMFGLFHGNLGQFVYTFGLGLFLAFLYVKTGKLKITIALHMLVNLMGGVFSLVMMNVIDLDELNMLLESGADNSVFFTYYMDHFVGVIMLLAYEFVVYGSMLAGGILIIVAFAKRRFKLAPGEVVIPKGRRFTTVFLNVGMLLYCIFWIALIILQLLM